MAPTTVHQRSVEVVDQLNRRFVESGNLLSEQFHSSADGPFFFRSAAEDPEEEDDENEELRVEVNVQEKEVINPTEEVAAVVAAASARSVMDLSDVREGLTMNHLVVPVRRAFIEAQTRDTELQQLRS